MIDTSMYAQFAPRVKSVSEYLDEYAARDQRMQQNKLNALLLQDKQRGLDEQNRLRDLYAQPDFDPNTPEGLNRVMRVSPTQGMALRKDQLEAQKATAAIEKDRAESAAKLFELAKNRHAAYVRHMGALAERPDLSRDLVIQAGQQLVAMGIMPKEMFDAGIDRLPKDPQQLRTMLRTGVTAQLTPEQLLTFFEPKFEFKDSGQQIIPVQMNPNAPGYTPPVPIQKVATPGEVLTDQRTRSEGAATRAQADRHFNITQGNAGNVFDSERGGVVNTRDKTFTPVTAGGQPLGPKQKDLNDSQSKANLFGTRAKEADKILNTLAQSGVEQPGVIKRMAGATPLVGGGLAAATNFTQSEKQQQVEQAQRDFINAVLRRESGAVIGPDEFANANQQYFPQPGDKPEVIKQKARNRQIAIEGILAEVPQNRRGVAPQRNITVDW